MIRYFPIFRGKQFELIAVREFAKDQPENELIRPIIEPVRDPTANAGLSKMIEALEANKLKYTIVLNPGEGHLKDSVEAVSTIVTHLDESDATAENMSFGVLFHAGTKSDHILSAIDGSRLAESEIVLIHDRSSARPEDVQGLADRAVARHVVKTKDSVRTLGDAFKDPSYVQLQSNFKRRKSNTDYIGVPAAPFCHHLYLEEDSYDGLADYLTIGDDYSEGGALPLVLVIHLTYIDPESGQVYIRHFLSKSNKDQSDPAKKFAEALEELVKFINEHELDNPALAAFRAFHDESKYPGLGVIKKLSMLNHLYVMDAALREL